MSNGSDKLRARKRSGDAEVRRHVRARGIGSSLKDVKIPAADRDGARRRSEVANACPLAG
jgi:hypothetical protein